MTGNSLFPRKDRDVIFPIAGSLLLFAVVLLGGLAYIALVGGSSERLITAMLIDAIAVVGLQVYIGNTGVLSFGHIGFGAVAGYTFAILAISPERKARWIPDAPWGLTEVQVSPLLATIAAVAMALAVAVIIGIGLARSGAQSGAVAATVITLALLFVTHEVAANWTSLTGGNRAPLSFGIGKTLDSRLPIFAVLLGAIIAARLFAQSRVGRLAHAAREDNLAARAVGVNPAVQQMAALLISVAVVAMGASLRVFEIGNMTPRFFFFEYTLLTLVMLIVGGRNSVSGAIVGVVIITAGREFTRRVATEGYELFGLGLDGTPANWIFREGLPTIFLGLAMLGFMILRPNGLLDDWELDGWAFRRFRATSDEPERPEPLSHQQPATITTDDLTVDFGGFRALDNAAITASTGEIVGLIGPNGAGKTTLVNVITGMVEPTGGSVKLDHLDLTASPAHEISRAGLVRTFQNLRLFSALTVRENVEAAALANRSDGDQQRAVDVDAYLSAVGLWDLRDRRAGELDYGNSRRLELARAAAAGPRFLLLDEPTSGMSDAESLAMIEQVRSIAELIDAGVLVIDHDLNFITGISDRIYVLDRGRIIADGTPAEVQANPLVQAAYLGSSAGG